ncbi:hydroxymethylpyrimidine ABC transporter transmembrane component [Vibrio maritimus]|uniref:Hydroxymethylpyrimidine ABC transporter transmembrane component n=1 Tax=Vibrio maritimus TaxID=990268 RepID=A0A090T847_9VIBR|nr:hydroxymethylpyrimidine ABC transporter transmembrane component [Vibrio maritimus]
MTPLADIATRSHKQASKQSLSAMMRVLISLVIILALWKGIVVIFEMPSFILPAPEAVFVKLIERHDVLLKHTWVTSQEILLGLLLGLSMGLFFALQMLLFQPVKRWLLPILITSQAIPVFALAPILMLWLGYGIASKVVMAALIIFFPVTTCCYDGLRNTPVGYLDLSQTMGQTVGDSFGIFAPRFFASTCIRHSRCSCGCTYWRGCRRMGGVKRGSWLSHATN